MKKKILVTFRMPGNAYTALESNYDVTLPPVGSNEFSRAEVLDLIPEYDAILSMFNLAIDKELIDRAINLKIIAAYTVGYDHIDVDYATKKGIVVTNAPDPVTEPTADQAMGLMLALMRKISYLDRAMRIQGVIKWGVLDNLGNSLYGKTLGIIGMGRIGKAFARRAIASGMKIIYFNRNRMNPEIEAKYEAKYMSLSTLLSEADVVSLNAPLSDDTYHIINDDTINLMKPSAFLINTARGALVDELALTTALKQGKIAGAALDVFEFGSKVTPELLEMDNVVINPHTGTQTHEARNEMAEFAVKNIINFFEHTGNITNVNPLT